MLHKDGEDDFDHKKSVLIEYEISDRLKRVQVVFSIKTFEFSLLECFLLNSFAPFPNEKLKING